MAGTVPGKDFAGLGQPRPRPLSRSGRWGGKRPRRRWTGRRRLPRAPGASTAGTEPRAAWLPPAWNSLLGSSRSLIIARRSPLSKRPANRGPAPSPRTRPLSQEPLVSRLNAENDVAGTVMIRPAVRPGSLLALSLLQALLVSACSSRGRDLGFLPSAINATRPGAAQAAGRLAEPSQLLSRQQHACPRSPKTPPGAMALASIRSTWSKTTHLQHGENLLQRLVHTGRSDGRPAEQSLSSSSSRDDTDAADHWTPGCSPRFTPSASSTRGWFRWALGATGKPVAVSRRVQP